jgi:ferric-dicitrate binding protein FerR (iron transport regulator)
MKISALIRFLSCAFVATALSLSASAQSASGQIKAAKVDGPASKITAAGVTTPLKAGDVLGETETVITGKGGTVILAFENGSTVKLGSESRLAIDEFKIDPFGDSVPSGQLKNEPSVSKTALNLAYGEMVGDVKKLNKASSYSVKTPVGAAGIRGTIYRIVFKPDANGKAFFTITTAEGRVVMTGISDQEIPVDAGKEVVVEVDVANGNVTPKVVTQDIPAATSAQIATAAQDIAVQNNLQQFNTPTTTGGTGSPPPPPPAVDTTPTPPPPVLTNGAGQ